MDIKSNLRALLTALILLSITAIANAQELKLLEFREDVSMTDAVRFPKEDLNGDRCGLIRLGLVLPDATFEGDIVSSEYKDGEWWIYMPKDSNWLTIKSKSHVPLRCEFSDYGIKGIHSNVTYVMTVVEITGSGGKPKPTHQYLAFQVSPTNATLEVNGKIWELSDDGAAMKFVSFGNYSYRIQANDYHSFEGNVRVYDPDNTQKVKVDLKPNFGWIEVPGNDDLSDATIYIDNALAGKVPFKSQALKSGQHNVRISKELYETYNETVTISDEQTTKLTPKLKPNFAEITLKVDADAEIWVNNERKGIRTWTGKLEYGTCQIECRMTNHETSVSTHEITSKMAGKVIELNAPVPICGSLNIESTPTFANVFIDGKAVGETPRFISEILIGQHEVKLTKEGYYDYVELVIITKGEPKQITVVMDNIDQVQYNTYLNKANIAMNLGEFDEAIKNYRQAGEISYDDLVRKKINVAQSLKTEYGAVNEAVSQHRLKEANSHLSNMLTLDPDNSFILEKQREVNQMIASEKKVQRQNTRKKAFSVLWGSENKHANLGGFHIGLGGTFFNGGTEYLPGVRASMYYANYKMLPFHLNGDVIADIIDEEAYWSFGLGLGSSLTFTDKFAADYGVGWRYSLDDSEGGYYLDLGFTYMFDNKGWGGISYSYNQSLGESVIPSRHNVTYVLGKSSSLVIVGVFSVIALVGIGMALY